MTTNFIPAQLPNPNVALVTADGNITTVWYRALMQPLYQRTGGATGASSTDLAQEVANALSEAGTAQSSAQLALINSETALSQIGDVSGQATAAETAANNANTTANTIAGSALNKNNNLSDVSSVAKAQANLAINITPSGNTAKRPTKPATGQVYFDTSINMAIWFIGGGWVNASGVPS